MTFKNLFVRGLRWGYRKVSKKNFESPECIFDREVANGKIYNLLSNEKANMISRFGTTELITINNYLCIHSDKPYFRKLYDFVTDNTHTPWWFTDNFKKLKQFSGVFPPTQNISDKFAQLYLEDIPLIDILGSFQYYEKFMPLRPDVELIHLETLYPFFVENPWTLALKGKKVLVIHPFENTIKFQYEKRDKLFANKDILPQFELITIKAVQSAAGISVPFKDWFEALDYMTKQIEDIDFDICLLGCGAYGLPLAAHIKRMGKKAVHLGGGLQLLFGIKGKRWDDNQYGIIFNKKYPGLMAQPYNSLYNEYWIKPLEEDTPKSAKLLDGAVYW